MRIGTSASLVGAVMCFTFAGTPVGAQSTPTEGAAGPPPSTGKWVFAADSDDMTNKTDQRLTLAADDSSSDRLGRKVLSHLVISCGDMFRTNGHRAMIFDAGMPIRESGNAGGIIEYVDYLVRTDTDKDPENKRAQFVDAGRTMIYVPGLSGFFYSGGFLHKLLAAKTLRVRYAPLEGNTVETVSFTVVGLAEALKQLTRCRWD